MKTPRRERDLEDTAVDDQERLFCDGRRMNALSSIVGFIGDLRDRKQSFGTA